ncbi:MAG: hypothetical protein QOD83_3513 [Solirubrobacteraceae bacterium]|jgi:hypothetical protein|nr:hypothetical protein [Solirubrobacteraceae bacterium]
MIASVHFVVHVNPSQMNVDACALALPSLKMPPRRAAWYATEVGGCVRRRRRARACSAAASPVRVAEQHAHEQQDVAEAIASGAAALSLDRAGLT